MSDNQTEAANAMLALLERWRSTAADVHTHGQHTVRNKTVANWFASRDLRDFMTALASDASHITPGEPDASPFITQFLSSERPMANALGEDGVRVVREWVATGAGHPHPNAKTPSDSNALPIEQIPAFRSPAWYTQLPRWFTVLVNIEDHPGFEATAKRIAQDYLANAQFDAAPEFHQIEYSSTAFHKKMQDIYDTAMESFEADNFLDTGVIALNDKNYALGRLPHAAVLERLIQIAPFNLTDGAWLERIQAAAPQSEAQARLFQIWVDEAGNGIARQNHANVFDTLLKGLGVYLPPITSPDFTAAGFLPSRFSSPVFQLCVRLFPQEFFPELLGMTLYLEWSATPTLQSTVKMLNGRSIDSHFYRLHVAIDNITSGHGALAKEAIEIYLADKREEGGDRAVQEHWKRVWRGYVTWGTVGFDGEGLLERILQVSKIQINRGTPERPDCWPDIDEYYRNKMRQLIGSKAHAASRVHGSRNVGGRPLNELFADPDELMKRLQQGGYVDVNRPSQSSFFELLKFDGPMYKIFSPSERQIVLDWIETLKSPSTYPCVEPTPPPNGTLDPADALAALIKLYAARASRGHSGIALIEPGNNSPTDLPTLFGAPARLMAALVYSGWVVPGSPRRSGLMVFLKSEASPMRNVLSNVDIATVQRWIEAGAQQAGQIDAAVRRLEPLVTAAHVDPAAAEALAAAVGLPRSANVALNPIH